MKTFHLRFLPRESLSPIDTSHKPDMDALQLL